MKKLLASLALSCGLLLGGCNPVTVEQIQAATVTTCNFLPTAVTIASFIPGVAPYAVTAQSVALAICDALGHPPLGASKSGETTVRVFVNGAWVTVTGHYVK